MNAQENLRALYEEWRLLSEKETEAIQSEIWEKVQECQDNKTHLKNLIILGSERLENELAFQGIDSIEIKNRFKPIVEQLILLETRNDEILTEKRQRVSREMEESEKSFRTLRQVHNAYSPNHNAMWHSYS